MLVCTRLIFWHSQATISYFRVGRVTGGCKRVVSPVDRRVGNGSEKVVTDKQKLEWGRAPESDTL